MAITYQRLGNSGGGYGCKDYFLSECTNNVV